MTFVPFDYPTCETPGVFIVREMWIRGLSHMVGKIYLSEFSIHVIILTLFASVIAPFGGFFASGFKRSMKIKDFSNLIPGHGGLLDRLDCHIVMMVFTYVYLSEVIKGRSHSLSSVLLYITRLSKDD